MYALLLAYYECYLSVNVGVSQQSVISDGKKQVRVCVCEVVVLFVCTLYGVYCGK